MFLVLFWCGLLCLAGLGLLLLSWDPLDKEVDIVLLQVNVVERLLRVKGAHNIFKRDQSVLLLTENSDFVKLAKHAKDLKSIKTHEQTYHLDVLFAELVVLLHDPCFGLCPWLRLTLSRVFRATEVCWRHLVSLNVKPQSWGFNWQVLKSVSIKVPYISAEDFQHAVLLLLSKFIDADRLLLQY